MRRSRHSMIQVRAITLTPAIFPSHTGTLMARARAPSPSRLTLYHSPPLPLPACSLMHNPSTPVTWAPSHTPNTHPNAPDVASPLTRSRPAYLASPFGLVTCHIISNLLILRPG